VTSDIFCCGVDNDVCTQIQWSLEIWGWKSIINNQGNFMIFGDFCTVSYVDDCQSGICRCFDIETARFFIDTITKINANFYLGNISLKKGELDMALKNFKQSASISEEINDTYNLGNSLMWAGYVYRLQRKPELAIEYLERSLKLSEKYQYPALYMCLQTLVETHVDNKSRQQAEIYLEQLKKLTIQKSVAKNQYLFAKAYFLKSSKRMRDFTKAEKILREFIWDNDSLLSLYHTGSMILLCDLLLKELLVFNNPEVLDEINKLITRLLNVSEKEHSFWWLAETKLLQAKLTLIRLDIEGAKRLLVQAQRIAELHEIYNLAQRISRAHDRLLDQEEIWNKLKQIDAPMSERINLASFDGVISRLQGKHSGEPTNIPPEDPICLLIIEEGGILVFSHFFSEKLSFEDDLVSNFLIAFNSFSEEVFSKGLDRAKFGEYTLIMQSVGFFSVCYLFEGQSYLAMQKLTRFADKMQNHNSIWQKFKDFQKTHQIITLKNNPLLERAIFDIFLIES